MKKSILEFWVGLFVLLGVCALGVLAFQVAGGKGIGGSKPTYTVYADFTDIGGLKANAPVRVSGVLVGRVANIQLNPENYQARATLHIDKQYEFSSDVSASILTSGLLGEQYIGLQQGGDVENLAEGGTIEITSSALVLENLIGKFMTSFTGNKDNSSDKKSDDKPAAE